MADNMDLELNARLDLSLPMPDIGDEPDAYDEFFATARIAAYTGWDAAEGIQKQVANIKAVRRATAPAPSRDAQPLEKRDEMVSFYENWLSGQMATLGKSSAEVVEAWRADFPDAQPDIVAALEQAQRIVDGV